MKNKPQHHFQKRRGGGTRGRVNLLPLITVKAKLEKTRKNLGFRHRAQKQDIINEVS